MPALIKIIGSIYGFPFCYYQILEASIVHPSLHPLFASTAPPGWLCQAISLGQRTPWVPRKRGAREVDDGGGNEKKRQVFTDGHQEYYFLLQEVSWNLDEASWIFLAWHLYSSAWYPKASKNINCKPLEVDWTHLISMHGLWKKKPIFIYIQYSIKVLYNKPCMVHMQIEWIDL